MKGTSAFNMLLQMDALFDTRMGTLVTLEPEISKYLPLKEYRSRQLDDFSSLSGGHIDRQTYQERYSCRDQEVLRNSMITGIVPVLITYIDGLKERFFRGVDVDSVGVDLNIFPYVIPGPILETIKGCLEALLPPYAVVNVINADYKDMTPDWIEYRYNGWATYDFHKWLEVHSDRLLVKPLNGLSVILPRVFMEDPRERVVEENAECFRIEDRHSLLEMVMEDYVHLEHLPVQDFCFLLPGTYNVPDYKIAEDEEKLI